MPAVTLDLWHTLMFLPADAEERYMETQVEVARRALAAANRRPGAPDRTEAGLGRAFEEEYARAVALAGDGVTVTPAEQFRRTAEATGRDADVEAYLAALEPVVRQLALRRAPGALELLRSLREDGYGVAVISNTVGEPGAFLRPTLTAMGFDPYVEAYVFSDELPWTKPAPEIFRSALSGLGASPGEAVHVGDGWSDIEGARRAGYRAGILFTGLREYGERYRRLFLPDGWADPPSEHVARRLEEVGTLVRQLLPPGEGR